MKQLKRALLSTAVLAGLAAGNAYAGTEACFEINKIDATNGTATFALWATDYTPAACVVGAGDATTLAPFAPVSVAYELTGDLELEFDDFDANGATTVRALPFYIPTTDLPGGSRITMKLNGATFGENGDILHLVLATPTGNADEYTLESVASTDGGVDGESEITFVTKAANTVSAGSRLLISRTNVFANPVTAADDATTANLLSTVVLQLNNSGCPTTPNVILSASNAVTDGGSVIVGGKSKAIDTAATTRGTAAIVVEAEAQFGLFNAGTQSGATAVDVNAEVPSLRTQFVFNHDGSEWTPERVRSDFAWFEAAVSNKAADLDRSVTLDAADRVVIHAAATGPTGSTVVFDAYSDLLVDPDLLTSDTTAELFGENYSWGSTFAGALSADNLALPEANDPATVGAKYLSAVEVFNNDVVADTDGSPRYFTIENSDADGVMNFNYEVNVRYGIQFANEDYISLSPSCNPAVNTHDVGVNGAVLKVPYTVDATGNFVRISNEHTSDAEITMDVFGENLTPGAAGKEAVGVNVGTVPAKSSVILSVAELIQKAKDQKAYTGDVAAANTNGKRHFMTFTVTAPKNKVHGVSVQKITGGNDRVIPVLDMNDWQE